MNRLSVTFIVIAAVLSGCGRQASPSRPSNVIVIGADPVRPPFTFEDSVTGAVVGFDVDLFSAVCQANRWQCEFRAVAGDRLADALSDGDIDIAVAEPLESAEDSTRIVHSDPYYLTGIVLVVSTEQTSPPGAESWQGLTVAVPADLPSGVVEGKLKGVKVRTYAAPEEVVPSLEAGQLAALAADYTAARRLTADRPGLRIVPGMLTTTYYTVAMRADDRLRLDEFNDALASLLGGYTYERLHAKWFGYPLLNVAVPDSVSARWDK